MINEAKIEKPDARSQGCARGANGPTHRGPSSTKIVKKSVDGPQAWQVERLCGSTITS